MENSPVLLQQQEDIAVLTLCAPERRNAISTAMRVALREKLRQLAEDDTVRGIVLTGAGGHFCSGGDISEMAPPESPPIRWSGGAGLRSSMTWSAC
ncbi:enoyl-CoA hydratase/isomerase family protein [Ottowia sp. VDI28]|uniref:enoyl-CoA hydratase/isomerase family protein n=1 Tax=Ottowia sp. VDI28 TaxID=3133968 RepID=UPI003C2F6905